MPQGPKKANEGLSPDVFLMPFRQSCSVGCVSQGQCCPFKIFFLEDSRVVGQAGTQPADIWDVLGDYIIADRVEVQGLPQGG